jgi:hypothetical protein
MAGFAALYPPYVPRSRSIHLDGFLARSGRQALDIGALPMSSNNLLPVLLIVHGVIGAIDTLVNHELIAQLPHHVEAKREVGIHVLREAAYGFLFSAIAWFVWHGAWAVLIGITLLGVLAIDAADEFVENRTRVLPQNERMLHFALILNLGFITFVLLPVLVDWYVHPTALLPARHGVLSWVLSALGLAAFIWSLRDLVAWRKLRKISERYMHA